MGRGFALFSRLTAQRPSRDRPMNVHSSFRRVLFRQVRRQSQGLQSKCKILALFRKYPAKVQMKFLFI